MVVKCLNQSCTNELPYYRHRKKTGQISRWYFCVECLKYKNELIEYPCFNKNCNIILTTANRQFRKYCSPLCKSRHLYKTVPSEIKRCQECGHEYMSNLGYKQKFCGEVCRTKSHRMVKNKKARQQYRKNKQLNKTKMSV